MPTPSSQPLRAPLASLHDSPAPVVLVAMEHFVERAAIAAILRESGFAILEASSTEGLLRSVRERAVHCVLVELELRTAAGKGALDACRELRQESEGAAAPAIVCLSASREPHATALEAGADSFLALPVDPAVLVASVHALLRSRAAWAAPPRP